MKKLDQDLFKGQIYAKKPPKGKPTRILRRAVPLGQIRKGESQLDSWCVKRGRDCDSRKENQGDGERRKHKGGRQRSKLFTEKAPEKKKKRAKT